MQRLSCLAVLFIALTVFIGCADKQPRLPEPTRVTPSEPVIQFEHVISITVDYNQTLEEMIAAGQYDVVRPDITPDNFPINQQNQNEAEIHIILFDRPMESDEVIAEFEKLGLRPAKLPEPLAFGAKHLHTQSWFAVIALGSSWEHPGGRLAPYLSNIDDEVRSGSMFTKENGIPSVILPVFPNSTLFNKPPRTTS